MRLATVLWLDGSGEMMRVLSQHRTIVHGWHTAVTAFVAAQCCI